MSFILDALRKSEAERQQQAGAERADVPSSSSKAQSMKWLWILAVILLVNLAVLLGILIRPGGGSEPGTRAAQPAATQPDTAHPAAAQPDSARPEPVGDPAPEQTFEEQVAEAKRKRSDALPVAEDVPEAAVAPVAGTSSPQPQRRYVKTIDELRLEGVLQVADLHLDIHVFADEPAERFVFINMKKYRENSKLAEGPIVREITTDGVVLEHQGMTFLLPRE